MGGERDGEWMGVANNSSVFRTVGRVVTKGKRQRGSLWGVQCLSRLLLSELALPMPLLFNFSTRKTSGAWSGEERDRTALD